MFHPQGPTFKELVQQALSSTKDGYDMLAPKFDYTPFKTPEFLIQVCYDYIKPMGPFERAADICTGTGAAIGGLIPMVEKQIVGIDWSFPMLAEARKKFTTGPPIVDLVHMDMYDIPYTEVFDLVTTFGALGHIEKHRYQEFVDKMARMLKPGGIFVFVTVKKPMIIFPSFWTAFVFDTLMKIRNYFIKPEFIMYYLNFLLPDIVPLFQNDDWENFQVVPIMMGRFTLPFRLVIATKKKTL